MPRMPQNKCDCDHRCPPPPSSDGSVDVKLKIIRKALENELVQRDLIKTFDVINLADADPEAYLYLDNAGNPTRLKLSDLQGKSVIVEWDQLSEEVQNKILEGIDKQDKLTAGENITITGNVISAKGGNVDSINGKTGVVTLTAEDIDAYDKGETAAFVQAKVETIVPQIIKEELQVTALDGGLIN